MCAFSSSAPPISTSRALSCDAVEHPRASRARQTQCCETLACNRRMTGLRAALLLVCVLHLAWVSCFTSVFCVLTNLYTVRWRDKCAGATTCYLSETPRIYALVAVSRTRKDAFVQNLKLIHFAASVFN